MGYGHVLRREVEYVGKRVMVLEVPGKTSRRRQKRKWFHNTRDELSERELSGEEAQDSVRSIGVSYKKHRPHIKVGKDAVEE